MTDRDREELIAAFMVGFERNSEDPNEWVSPHLVDAFNEGSKFGDERHEWATEDFDQRLLHVDAEIYPDGELDTDLVEDFMDVYRAGYIQGVLDQAEDNRESGEDEEYLYSSGYEYGQEMRSDAKDEAEKYAG